MKLAHLALVALIAVGAVFLLPHDAQAFLQQWNYSTLAPAGFWSGIWHGLLAPWSLIARWFIDGVEMYALYNTGWFYDFGFLIGVGGSFPVGWIAAIISVLLHVFA
ncbi:MAG: hypothetical protein RLZZ283_778 [Candidatus Parcubacteria bacterium]|jgi:hypothetical protein